VAKALAAAHATLQLARPHIGGQRSYTNHTNRGIQSERKLAVQYFASWLSMFKAEEHRLLSAIKFNYATVDPR
jgi:hypothetical protein